MLKLDKPYEEALQALLKKQELERLTLETEYLVNGLFPISPIRIFIPENLKEKARVRYVAYDRKHMLNFIKSIDEYIVPVVYATNGCFTISPRNLLDDGFKIDGKSELNFYIQSEMNRHIDNETRNSLLFYVLIDGFYFRVEISLNFPSVRFLFSSNRGIKLPPKLKSENRRIPFSSGDLETQSCYFMIADLEEFFDDLDYKRVNSSQKTTF